MLFLEYLHLSLKLPSFHELRQFLHFLQFSSELELSLDHFVLDGLQVTVFVDESVLLLDDGFPLLHTLNYVILTIHFRSGCSQYKISIKTKDMPNYDADLSLNELLGLLRHYKAEGWSKQGSQFSFEGTTNSIQQHFNSTFQVTTNRTHESPQKMRMAMTAQQPTRKTNTLTPKYQASQSQNEGVIFERLYKENQRLKDKREQLWREARKECEQRDQKECTFSPCISGKKRARSGSCGRSLGKNDSIYVKNLEWQQRKNQSIKLKRIEKNGQSLKDLTFTPKINSFKRRSNKENSSDLLMSRKGVEEHLRRQSKAKRTADCLLETRLRQPSPPQKCVIQKGYFSYRS